MRINCKTEGCLNFIEIETMAVYTCRDHASPAPDQIRFQEHQFDPDIARGSGYLPSIGPDDPDFYTLQGSSRVDTRPPNIDGDDSGEG
jgi:hypothetical protein